MEPGTTPTLAEQREQQKQIFLRWRNSSLDFSREGFKFKSSNQQKEFFIELSKLINAKRKADEGQPMTDEEKEYSKKRGISVMAAKGVGKDACMSIAAFWFHLMFDSRSYLVAPSLDNLKSSLLAEMSKWLSRKDSKGNNACIVRDLYHFMSESCYLEGDPDRGKSWYIRSCTAGPSTPADKQLEVLSGKHHRYMGFFITEASGVPDAVFSPIDTTFTDPVNFMILMWNPTRRNGFAYDTHFGKEQDYWIKLHWSAEDSDMVTPDQIEYLQKKYGKDSPEYRVSVLGMPPEADPGSVIPYEWVHEAAHKDKPNPEQINAYPVVFGVDVANQGEDKSVILVRQGPLVHEIVEYQHLDTVELAQWVMRTANLWEPSAIYIETNGMGIGVYDHLKRFGQPNIRAVNVARAPTSDKYQRVRDELWFKARERFQEGSLFIPNNAKLISELSTPKFEVKERGRVKVESKLNMRKRGILSPNMADALILTFTTPDDTFKLSSAQARENREYQRKKANRSVSKHSWMRV